MVEPWVNGAGAVSSAILFIFGLLCLFFPRLSAGDFELVVGSNGTFLTPGDVVD